MGVIWGSLQIVFFFFFFSKTSSQIVVRERVRQSNYCWLDNIYCLIDQFLLVRATFAFTIWHMANVCIN